MTITTHVTRGLLAGWVLASAAASAAPIQFNVSATVSAVEGSYLGGVAVFDTINGTFVVDNDTANAGPGSDAGPGTNSGHEYTSFWEFNGPPYSAHLLNVQQAGSFNSDTQAIVVNDGLTLTAEDTAGLIPDGTYDWLEILGATTSDYCPEPGDICTDNQILVADGEEWTLAIFAADDNWFTGGDIPQSLPSSFTAFLIGFEYNEFGEETGLVLAPADSLSLTQVPLPAAFWLFASSLAALGWIKRRRHDTY